MQPLADYLRYFKRLVDVRKGLFEFFFTFNSDLQAEIISHMRTVEVRYIGNTWERKSREPLVE